MLFEIRSDDIIENLQSTVSVIEKKQTMPILSNVLIRTDHDNVIMTGTDLEIQLVTRTKAHVLREGSTTVSARKLYDICRNLPQGSNIKVELQEDNLQLRSGRTRFRLATLDPGSFPEFSTESYVVDVEIDCQIFRRLLQSTAFCMATQDIRYYLNGLKVELQADRIESVASNGHRLAMYHESLGKLTDLQSEIIIPRKGILELLHLLDNETEEILRLKIGTANIEVDLNRKIFLSKLIEGKFPDFKGALSQPICCELVMDTQVLKSALQRVSILSTEKFKKITLLFSDHVLQITSDNTEQEQAMEEIDVDFTGEPYEVAMNVSYLLEAISNVHNETVNLAFTENSNICLIGHPRDPKLNYVIMPLL